MTSYIWPEGGGGTGGISELTGDVTAGPGSGAQAATVEGLQGSPVSNAAPSLNDVLTWDGTQWLPAPTSGVTSVGGTAPIASSGGSTPTISISAATTSAAGSMSAADKTKLDGLPSSPVASVGGTAPISSSGGTTPTISISAATTLAAGSMSAADKTKLDGITPGAAVASVGTTSPITNTGTATAPVVALTSGSAINDVLAWNGAQWVSSAPPLTRLMLALSGTSTSGAVAYISAVYLPAGITLTAASQAYIGGNAIGDSTTLSLVAISGGLALATWTISGTLGVATVAGPPVVVPAGWYDLTLQGTAGSGVAFARGLYLA